MRDGLVLVLCLLMISCGTRQSPVPALESFDHLKPDLNRVDSAAGQVSVDVTRLNRLMQADDSASVKTQSVTLERQARRLRTLSGRAGNMIRTLVRRDRRRVVRVYFKMAVQILSSQWREGRTLERLAHLVWADPLSMSPSDARKLRSLSRSARHDAGHAVLIARKASAWRREHAHDFQYSAAPRKA